ncbi:CCA tRNA nucleotidyltransferase [Candidatus Daviesbacteria bacterium]|nr:CCA tRNA nucleotidyltransferase [Candidatus Daviesbacteria bacterium]
MDYKLPKEVLEILNKFKKANYQIYIVGGAVRDLLMDRQVRDWDFTTDAKPEEILKLFPQGFYDNKFGTVGVPIKMEKAGGSEEGSRRLPEAYLMQAKDSRRDTELTGPAIYEVTTMRKEGDYESRDKSLASSHPSQIIEITTMRREGDYRDHRHPVKVGWTNKIEEDLARRDFTINAMALADKIADPFNGQQDLKDKLVCAVGDPNLRFKEDALRLIRAIRIASELEFDIEKVTFLAIVKNAQLIKEIAWERIRDELFKILASMNPYVGIDKLREAGILQIILPELERCFGLKQEGPKHDRVYDIGKHSLLTLKFTPSSDPLVRLAALLHDIGKPETVNTQKSGNVTFYNHDKVGGDIVIKIAQRFNLSKKQTDKLFKLVRWHLFSVDENQTNAAIRRFIKNVGLENIQDMMALRIGDRLGGGTEKAVSWRMDNFKSRIKKVLEKPFSISDLKVNGKDVMKVLNIKPGPKVGQVLEKLFKEVLEDSSKNNKEYLLKRIKELKD